MIETTCTNSRRHVKCVLIVVIAVFVTLPNHRLHTVAATPNDDYSGSSSYSNYQRNFRRRYGYYPLEGDDLYSPYNPLWREEQVYTGERRGPITESSYFRRPRRSKSIQSPPHSPLAPHIQDIDGVSSASSFSEFPLQSADIGRRRSSNDIYPGGSQKPRERRSWSFPIDFKRKRGRLNIGFDNDSSPTRSRLLASEMTKPRKGFSSTSGNTKTAKEAQSNRTAGRARSSNNVMTRGDQVTFSLDPFSMATLLQNGLTAFTGIGSVYIATLKLLGPMILAKHCLTTVGHIANERMNGRLLGKSSTERIGHSEQDFLDKVHEKYAPARAVTRTLFQIMCMSCAGQLVGFVLDRTPCLLEPFWICQWWYGVVWLASVSAVGFLCQESIMGHSSQTAKYPSSLLTIQPAFGTIPFTNPKTNTVVDPHGRRNMARPVFQFFQKMSQNPEEWIHGLFRSVPRWQNHRRIHTMPEGETSYDVQVDPLLFPSTWKPLSVLTFLALSRAICQSFCLRGADPVGTLGDATCAGNKQFLILRSFLVQKVLYSEWHRVFLQERRVALGAGVSLVGLLALLWSMYTVSTVDSIAALAMAPTLMARMVSTW
eukprot:CAMPEP_0116134130 /NCGR_PEP_ID=MMETSP0329-20121206/10483_1 /TAXON_ID=697910 /ORGANISM="Pseudo-nitzschia arenysensis, Strain B593" /LENGTH=597 /DNA_ID=CAMNT_0003628823 /DNA_START=58 /DNA_END=1848 /DNA_ORIENTATION=+